MYQDLKQHFRWHGMKSGIAQFVARCLVCQQMKTEHQRIAELVQPLPIPECKRRISLWTLSLHYRAVRKGTMQYELRLIISRSRHTSFLSDWDNLLSC